MPCLSVRSVDNVAPDGPLGEGAFGVKNCDLNFLSGGGLLSGLFGSLSNTVASVLSVSYPESSLII